MARPMKSGAFSFYASLKRVHDYARQESTRELSLERAAEIAHMAPKYFSSFFHAKVGIRFVEWRTRLRVERARELLIASDRPVADVAHEVGFDSSRSLERAFRRTFDRSPRSIRGDRPE